MGFIPFASQRTTQQGRMHSRKFCCCFPVRIGVFILSILTGLLSAASAYVVWYTVIRTYKHGTVASNLSTLNGTTIDVSNGTTSIDNSLNGILLDKSQLTAFIIIGGILSFYALTSLFGLIGSIIRKRRLVSIYSFALWLLLIVNLFTGIYSCWATAQQRSTLEAQCLANHSSSGSDVVSSDINKVASAACDASSNLHLVLYILGFVLQWLIQLYACVIVRRYVDQLSDEQAYNEASGSYYAHQPLNHELGPYPYGRPDNSFGAKA